MSGKGGVGKSLLTSLLASAAQKRGARVGILDGDITGPSIPKVFGLKDKAEGSEEGIYPLVSKSGIKIMSVNLLLEEEEDPVIWRGPVISGVVKQFWSDVIWGELDYLFIDMPPGTGDVPLTVFQSVPLDGAILVTAPQDLVSLIVKKAYHMAEKMNIPLLGIVENMSYMKCPDCGKILYPFGEGQSQNMADSMGLPFLGKLPIVQEIAALCDAGRVEDVDLNYCSSILDAIEAK